MPDAWDDKATKWLADQDCSEDQAAQAHPFVALLLEHRVSATLGLWPLVVDLLALRLRTRRLPNPPHTVCPHCGNDIP